MEQPGMETEVEPQVAATRAAGYRNLLRNPGTWSSYEYSQIEAKARFWERQAETNPPSTR